MKPLKKEPAGSYLVHLRKVRAARKTLKADDGVKHIHTKTLCGQFVLKRHAVRVGVRLTKAVCPDCMKLAKTR